jgi:hypothetical protein
MMMFIMSKHSRSSDAAGSGPPPQALQAAASAAGLGSLIARAQGLDALDRRLRHCLPDAMANECRLANVDGDRLVFLVSGPVWKSKLRLMADVLLDAAAAAGHPARALVVKVVPSLSMLPDVPGPAAGKPLSQAVRESLRATARSVEDPDLRAQLLKLASMP